MDLVGVIPQRLPVAGFEGLVELCLETRQIGQQHAEQILGQIGAAAGLFEGQGDVDDVAHGRLASRGKGSKKLRHPGESVNRRFPLRGGSDTLA